VTCAGSSRRTFSGDICTWKELMSDLKVLAALSESRAWAVMVIVLQVQIQLGAATAAGKMELAFRKIPSGGIL